ncbi:MAG: HAD-IIIC family phosphatase, partial [Chloroflexi bacterium]|nr:HAD-IIIC family phosphatase [Chloroflexota bacterium]
MIFQDQLDKAKAEKKFIKCVVWDLDNTVWRGVLLEDKTVVLKEEAVALIKEMDRRGILNSIASKNNLETAWAQLEAFGIADYFLYPEINWNPKSASLRAISQSLNIGLDTFAFVDDSQFEREEVAHELPDVLCLDAVEMDTMRQLPQFMPRFITPESGFRRKMYMSDMQRNRVEDSYIGNNEDFLTTLGMVFRIKQADESDLQRAEELTVRTNQLNTTGYTYSYQELNELRQSPQHLLLVSSLDDKYGTYGTIGLALVAKDDAFWTVKLLLMSCRVMSRGVGTIMMSYIMQQATAAGVRLCAEFMPNGRNRMMYVTYKFGGFREI